MTDLSAAERRQTLYRTRGDRPQQRCAAAEGRGRGVTAPGNTVVRSSGAPSGSYWTGDPGDIADGDVYWTGLASSTGPGNGYEMYDSCGPYTEVVERGAFGQSLALGAALDVPLVIQHDDARRLARTTIPWGTRGALQLQETDSGLEFQAQMDPDDPDVAYATRKVDSGLMTECSFRFGITLGEWSPDFTTFVIRGVDLQRGDVSLVGYGANPNTGASVGRAIALDDDRAAREIYDRLHARFAAKPAPVRRFLVRDDDLR